MKKTLLTAVSVLALIGAGPVLAETQANMSQPNTPGSEKAAAQSTGDITKDAKKAWTEMKKDAKSAYEEIEAALMDENEKNMAFKSVRISTQTTANGMIGEPVHNAQERVGTVKDIILNRDGKPVMVIVADGDFFGLGKLAAFDYASMVKVGPDGDIMMPLTEEAIDRAAEFSYDREDYSETVRVIPSNGYSASKLLNGQLIDTKGKTLGQIDDIQFRGAQASHLIVGFDKVMGLGGENAAMKYTAAKVVQDGDDYDFQLNADKTAQFEHYKETAVN